MTIHQLKKYHRYLLSLAIRLAVILTVILFTTQALIISHHPYGEQLTLLSRIEGEPAPQTDTTLLASNMKDHVDYVRLSLLNAAEGDLVRIYLDHHLIGTIEYQKNKTVALSENQNLSVEGARLAADTLIEITLSDGEKQRIVLAAGEFQTIFAQYQQKIVK